LVQLRASTFGHTLTTETNVKNDVQFGIVAPS
jgi:hypothetical protein